MSIGAGTLVQTNESMSLPLWVFGRQMKWHGRLHVLPIECKGDFPGTHLAHKWDSDAAYALPLLHTLFFEPLFHWLQTVFIPFAASFIYMNGDKPRSEYYHLRSICCYTTDFELNLQNEKISTNPQYSPSSPGLCAGEKSERTKQICFLLNPEDLHGNKKQRFKGRCVFTTVQSDPDAAHAQKTWGQWLYALQEVWVEQALFE